ncbi:MAG: endonuclease Q family protein, partial [Patescibacteria group bacterium]
MALKIIDLHIHSKYSRACSRDLELPKIAKACEVKGIDIVATGDFTHPGWFKSMEESLVPDADGIYKLKNDSGKTKFVIGTEVAVVRKHKDKTRRVHLLLFAPDMETAGKFNRKLESDGFNLRSDGRPILGLTCKELLKTMLAIDDRMVMIPAHAWTPWFGIFGSKGGYDALDEAFDELTERIFAIETGLSSDPAMNWRLSKLDDITLVSNSDAHSLPKLGREANVLEFASDENITYAEIMRVLREKDKKKFKYTIEFYPEEGKYHFDGHRDCHFFCAPEETKKLKGICPKCKRPLTVGVMNRVHELSDRDGEEARRAGVIPFLNTVPLLEIIAGAFNLGVGAKRVQEMYLAMTRKIGNELDILTRVSLADILVASNKE